MAGFGNEKYREQDSMFDDFDNVVAAGTLPDGEYMGILAGWRGKRNVNGTPLCAFRFVVLHDGKRAALEHRAYWSEAAKPHTKKFCESLGIDLRNSADDYPPLYVYLTVKNQESGDGRVFSEVVGVKRLANAPEDLVAALEAAEAAGSQAGAAEDVAPF